MSARLPAPTAFRVPLPRRRSARPPLPRLSLSLALSLPGTPPLPELVFPLGSSRPTPRPLLYFNPIGRKPTGAPPTPLSTPPLASSLLAPRPLLYSPPQCWPRAARRPAPSRLALPLASRPAPHPLPAAPPEPAPAGLCARRPSTVLRGRPPSSSRVLLGSLASSPLPAFPTSPPPPRERSPAARPLRCSAYSWGSAPCAARSLASCPFPPLGVTSLHLSPRIGGGQRLPQVSSRCPSVRSSARVPFPAPLLNYARSLPAPPPPANPARGDRPVRRGGGLAPTR